MERGALWRKVINSKYQLEGTGWIPKMELNRKVSSIWRDIMQIQVRQSQMVDAYKVNVRLKVGDGKSILFWKDMWLGNSTFDPSIYLSFLYSK